MKKTTVKITFDNEETANAFLVWMDQSGIKGGQESFCNSPLLQQAKIYPQNFEVDFDSREIVVSN